MTGRVLGDSRGAPGATEEPAPSVLRPFEARIIALIIGAELLYQLVTTGAYGLHGNDLHQLAQSRRMAWAYVDTMPMTPFAYKLSALAFGTSPLALHSIAILVGLVNTAMAAMIAREVGGARRAQVSAALIAAMAPLFLGSARFLAPFTFDLLWVTVGTWTVLRLVRTRDTRLWVAFGAVVGLGILNKLTVVVWVASLLAGLAMSRHRRLLWSGWLVVGGLVALALPSPSIAWLLAHQTEYREFLASADTSPMSLVFFVVAPFLAATPVGAVYWIRALVSARDPILGPRMGFLAPAFAGNIALVFFAGAAAGQTIPVLLPLTAVGTVAVERYWSPRAGRRLIAAFVVLSVAMFPFTSAVLPAATVVSTPVGAVFNLKSSIGAHDVARDIARAYHARPPSQRVDATILTYTSNEAAVVEYWADDLGLPQPISGQTNYGLWGYGDAEDGAPVLVVGFPPGEAEASFAGCRQVATIGSNGRPMTTNEAGRPILWCERPRAAWSALWPTLQRYERM